MNRVLICISILFLAACSTSSNRESSTSSSTKASDVKNQRTQTSNMSEDNLLFYLLRKEFSKWQGTPYRLGGNSKKGIDCSALVQNIYRDSFNITLPRTTETQVEQGYLVYRNQLQIGDLVFFKTGWNTRHVGIYIGNEEFIHASTSQGVITSSLNNVYWKPRYWQAKRILD
ncbi:NlpC/P60 family protein [Psychromonas marina]|nr:NlpC/P60 family protein [Psychromonas marina]